MQEMSNSKVELDLVPNGFLAIVCITVLTASLPTTYTKEKEKIKQKTLYEAMFLILK